jgi:hypothetical protein
MVAAMASRRMCVGTPAMPRSLIPAGFRSGFVTARMGRAHVLPQFAQLVRPATTASVSSGSDSLLVEMTAAEVSAKATKPGELTRTITMVKKLMPDGTACRKCDEIQLRLEKDGLEQHIDSVLYMDPNTPGVDQGTKMAMQHGVKTAPFFVVRTHNVGLASAAAEEDAHEDVYTAYLKMKKQVFGKTATVAEADNDIAMSIF